MINVPISIASALAASSVPALTASYAESDMENVRFEINAAIRFIMVVAFPCAVGLSVLATPIFTLLFPGTVSTVPLASKMMLIGSSAVIFYSISTLSNGLLQGIDRLKVPVINAIIALVAHLLLLVLLMITFRLHIYAVVIANCFFSLLMCLLNAKALSRYSGYKQEIKKTFLIPGICSTIMGAITAGVYYLGKAVTHSNVFSVLFAIFIAVVVYAVLLLLFHGLTEEEIQRFPKGNTFIRIAKKCHLLPK